MLVVSDRKETKSVEDFMNFIDELCAARMERIRLQEAYATTCEKLDAFLSSVVIDWSATHPEVKLKLVRHSIEHRGLFVLRGWDFLKPDDAPVANVACFIDNSHVAVAIHVGIKKTVSGRSVGFGVERTLFTDDLAIIEKEVERAFIALAADPTSCVFWD